MCYVVLCSQCQDWSFVHHKHKLTQNWFRLLSSQARDLKAEMEEWRAIPENQIWTLVQSTSSLWLLALSHGLSGGHTLY